MNGRDAIVPKNRLAAIVVAALALAAVGSTVAQSSRQPSKPLRFEISFPASLRSTPVDGRLLLVVSTKNDKEPRMQIGEALDTQQFFGVDIDGLAPGRTAVIDESAQGYPRDSLGEVPDGEYYLQAVLTVYETFHRADGHVLKMHMDQGEGQHWNISPGNLLSVANKI